MGSGALFLILSLSLFFLSFVGLHLWHMGVPRLGVKSELQQPAYTTTAAMWDPSRILNPLIEARDRTRNFMVPSRIHFHCATTGTPGLYFFNKCFCQLEQGH